MLQWQQQVLIMQFRHSYLPIGFRLTLVYESFSSMIKHCHNAWFTQLWYQVTLQLKTHMLHVTTHVTVLVKGFLIHSSFLVQLKLQESNSFAKDHARKQISVSSHPTWDLFCGIRHVFWWTNKVCQVRQGLAKSSPLSQWLHHRRVLRNSRNGYSQQRQQTFLFFPQQDAPFTTFEHVWVAAPLGC